MMSGEVRCVNRSTISGGRIREDWTVRKEAVVDIEVGAQFKAQILQHYHI